MQCKKAKPQNNSQHYLNHTFFDKFANQNNYMFNDNKMDLLHQTSKYNNKLQIKVKALQYLGVKLESIFETKI